MHVRYLLFLLTGILPFYYPRYFSVFFEHIYFNICLPDNLKHKDKKDIEYSDKFLLYFSIYNSSHKRKLKIIPLLRVSLSYLDYANWFEAKWS